MCYMEVDLNVICNSFNRPQDYFGNEIKALDELEKMVLLRLEIMS